MSEWYENMTFDFGVAVQKMKQGKKVARKGWNGKGMYAFIIKDWSFTNGINDNFPCRQTLALKTAQDDVATWVPSGSDALAEDWVEV